MKTKDKKDFKHLTDDEILSATFHTIAKEKISGTRMHLIAQAAETSQSNLHYHFPTKNDLLLAVLDRLQHYFSQKRSASLDLKKHPFGENLHALFNEKKDDILHHPEIDCVQFDYLVQGTVDPDIREKMQHTFIIWRRDIASVLRQNDKVEKLPAPVLKGLPYLMVSLLLGASMQRLLDDGDFDIDAYFETAEQMILSFLDGKTEKD